jgi:hypothetical protein
MADRDVVVGILSFSHSLAIFELFQVKELEQFVKDKKRAKHDRLGLDLWIERSRANNIIEPSAFFTFDDGIVMFLRLHS